ncbi:Z1 domain-containing protein [Rhodococcus sp. MEB064]|uniref:Z1 domain-containing protein n=1 Tax=Rhodococcus sp. MEB064 TaxID=1587522 RepID=UPI0018CDAF7F|nr:Z1 domain-containing protein [Rhodococcus sp. MEB064]
MDPFYEVFAGWARKTSLDSAIKSFTGRLSRDELESYVQEYRKQVTGVISGGPPIIHGPREPWYAGPNASADVYWPALERFIRVDLAWPDGRVSTLDSSSNKVIAYTPRPNESDWDSKGLVVGYVQSGKTTNFTAVIAKAADVGYKFVIVLSGIHNGLRKQTQERLDEQLHKLTPTKWKQLTNADGDFRAPTMQSTALLHVDDSGVILAVVKKNAAVLKRLDKWLQPAVKQRALNDVPTLIIDDEADQASVETRIINPLIRGIIAKLPKSTYIGYTATPFANILIDPAAGDLYPKDFILNLPEPEGYFGTERIFGRDVVEGDEANGVDLDGSNMVRIIPHEDVDDVRPSGKSAAQVFLPSIPPTLDLALTWFVLATAARRARGDKGHATMLIHTSVKTDIHDQFRGPLSAFVSGLAKKWETGDPTAVQRLSSQWQAETSLVTSATFGLAPLTFEDVRPFVGEVLGKCRVVIDNFRSDDRLDYSEDGQVAIAVGGNTLSRGLTLEGLTVSYFVRAAGAYDTLLQMARWFGFRFGYEDLPRIWMTEELRQWFRHLATVEREIRLDIDRYESEDLTPTEFGVRIRTHPTLRITAKMGAAIPAYASYGGRRVQTRYFRTRDEDWLLRNVDAADGLLSRVRTKGIEPRTLDSGSVVFENVDADDVLSFLDSYSVHPDSPDLDVDLIGKYVAKQRRRGSLDMWNLAVMAAKPGSERGTVRLGGLDFGRIVRSQLKVDGVERSDIKTLMSKDHRAVDFLDQSEARKMSENSLMDARDKNPDVRSKGLILLYPIDPMSEPDPANSKSRDPLDARADVIGVALVFPGSANDDSKVSQTYVSVDLTDAEIESEDDELVALVGSDG